MGKIIFTPSSSLILLVFFCPARSTDSSAEFYIFQQSRRGIMLLCVGLAWEYFEKLIDDLIFNPLCFGFGFRWSMPWFCWPTFTPSRLSFTVKILSINQANPLLL